MYMYVDLLVRHKMIIRTYRRRFGGSVVNSAQEQVKLVGVVKIHEKSCLNGFGPRDEGCIGIGLKSRIKANSRLVFL